MKAQFFLVLFYFILVHSILYTAELVWTVLIYFALYLFDFKNEKAVDEDVADDVRKKLKKPRIEKENDEQTEEDEEDKLSKRRYAIFVVKVKILMKTNVFKISLSLNTQHHAG